jgi:hypothetical protein
MDSTLSKSSSATSFPLNDSEDDQLMQQLQDELQNVALDEDEDSSISAPPSHSIPSAQANMLTAAEQVVAGRTSLTLSLFCHSRIVWPRSFYLCINCSIDVAIS